MGKTDQSVILQSATAIYFVMVAWGIFLIRITDPAVLKYNKRIFGYVFCCRCMQKKQENTRTTGSQKSSLSSVSSDNSNLDDEDEFSDDLNAFLVSSLNLELVYTILKGIRSIANI